jgi:hypothetical protein
MQLELVCLSAFNSSATTRVLAIYNNRIRSISFFKSEISSD